MAKRIQGAKLVELAGADHIPYVGDSDALLDEIEEFLTGIRHGAEPDRILATVLFTDIVDSTKQAAELARFRGREVNTAGDYFLIAFDGPGRAVRCGMSISRQVRSLGIDTVSRPSSRNSWSEGARVDENSRLKLVSAHPWQQPGSVRASVTYRTR